jgi:sugar/nucleoside kinase (ribokinase family)
MKTVDIYAYGVISSSTLHLLGQPFPASEGYAEITHTYSMTGGEALNSSIVLSRLGLRVLLDGNWIGDTVDGKMILEIVKNYSIDTSRLRVKKGYPGVREIVFSDMQSRTIFGNYIDLLATTRKWNIPRKADLARSRMVCVDPPFQAESALVGRYSTELGIPYIAIDCPYDQELSIGAEAIIVSGEFREREYLKVDLPDLFSEYQKYAKGLVVFTAGSEEILYGRIGEAIKRFRPYNIKVIDSAGAGDSFRAGVIYGRLNKWNDDEVIQYAAALAGLVCGRFPGVLNSPTDAEVRRFIQERQKGKK